HQPESHDITQSQQSDPVFVRHIVCPEKRWFNRYGERFNVNHFGDCGRREKTSLPITFRTDPVGCCRVSRSACSSRRAPKPTSVAFEIRGTTRNSRPARDGV